MESLSCFLFSAMSYEIIRAREKAAMYNNFWNILIQKHYCMRLLIYICHGIMGKLFSQKCEFNFFQCQNTE